MAVVWTSVVDRAHMPTLAFQVSVALQHEVLTVYFRQPPRSDAAA